MGKRFGIRVKSTVLGLLLVLSGSFLIAAGTVSAVQDGDYNFTVHGGVATIKNYTGPGGAISIPSTLGGFMVVAIGEMAFYACTTLTSVIIPDGVTTIGLYAFAVCTSLTSMIIPDSVTYIEDYAFCYCDSLASINVSTNNQHFASVDGVLYDKSTTYLIQCPGGKTGVLNIPSSVTSIWDHAFSSCTSLTAIDVNVNNPSYASVDGVLYDKTVTNLLQCPDAKAGACTIPSSVRSIGEWAFADCTSLTSVTISTNVESIYEGAFYNCTSLTSMTIPNKVTHIGSWAFSVCTSLTSIIFLGLVAPTIVGTAWISNTGTEIRGHAYTASNFPDPDGDFHGLTMGDTLDESSDGNPSSDMTMLIIVTVIAVALVLVVVMFFMRKKNK